MDTLPLGGLPEWADAAYYCKELVEACQQRGWDYSVSVTDPRKKVPLLCIVNEMKLEEGEWEPLDEGGCEREVTVLHRSAGWAQFETYVVIRLDWDGAQLLLQPTYTVIQVRRDDLRVDELVRRHRGKQGQENAFNGPLTELGCTIRRARRTTPTKRFTGAGSWRSCC